MSRTSLPMPYWLQNLPYPQAQTSCTALVMVTDAAHAAPPREAEHRNASDQQRNARIDGTFPPSLRLGQQTTLSIFVHSLIQKETIVFVFH